MKHLLVVAHGSRRQSSNDEVRELVEKIRQQQNLQYDAVDCAFLELAEPSIPDGIEACIQSGAKEVVVLPYFLAAGRHVVEDIPELIKPKQEEHPDVCIHQARHIGALPGMVELMLSGDN